MQAHRLFSSENCGRASCFVFEVGEALKANCRHLMSLKYPNVRTIAKVTDKEQTKSLFDHLHASRLLISRNSLIVKPLWIRVRRKLFSVKNRRCVRSKVPSFSYFQSFTTRRLNKFR